MTTYVPALTLPDRLFASPAASILTPIVLGSAVGIGVSSKSTAWMELVTGILESRADIP